MCAPVDYGIVMVDYVSRSFVSAQGYSWPHQISLFHFEEREGSDKLDKWRSLEAAGLLENVRSQLADQREADIRMPFEHTRCLTDQPIDSAMVEWADRTLGLSDEERALWNAWIEERGRD
jgi:hypothetical protein